MPGGFPLTLMVNRLLCLLLGHMRARQVPAGSGRMVVWHLASHQCLRCGAPA